MDQVTSRICERERVGPCRLEQYALIDEALYGEGAAELRDMLNEHEEMVYNALRGFVAAYNEVRGKYEELMRLCDAKRSYGVPPEYSGVLRVEGRGMWSPTDTEVARVLVSISQPHGQVTYTQLVDRLDAVMSLSRAHIYRSLKVILRGETGRAVVITGLQLR